MLLDNDEIRPLFIVAIFTSDKHFEKRPTTKINCQSNLFFSRRALFDASENKINAFLLFWNKVTSFFNFWQI